ncbi:MAG: TonB-dependent receptor [Bacteroidetes bacterium]|nr:MAG: TonB-dependent receptor [Bacteroidota bacterium]
MYFTVFRKSGLFTNGSLTKTFQIMKLTTVFIIAACMQVSARDYSQKVTLNGNSITLQKVFEEIKKQTGYQFFYAEETIQSARPVTVSLKKVSLETALNAVFESQPLSYTISENTIIVRKKSVTSMMANEIVLAAPLPAPITGKVTDDKGQPLEGATVLIKGTPNGTKTNASGDFSIEADANATLIISYVGFITIEVKAVAGAANVQLKPQANSVEAVVVVGYGTSKKRDLTGSISSVKGEEVAKMPSTNPISSLQGKVPGLTVSNTGRAGATPVVRIRGVNSTNSANPVYVVDGILQDNIDFLNPADIESIDVLRDPSSIAIYGLRGANGVIAITSKKAARGQTRISLQSSVGIQTVNDKIELTDAAGFKKLYTAQLANINAAPFDYTNYTANTNWQDLVLRDAVVTATNLSISNSGEKSSTLLNVGYTNQEGVLKNDNFERFLLRLNEEIRINKNIKVGGEVTGYYYQTDPPAASITNALWAAPIVPIQQDEDTYYSMPSFQRAQVGNPIATLNRNNRNSIEKGTRVISSLFAEIKFLKSFTWRSTVYGDLWFNTARSYVQLPFEFINLGEGAAPTTITTDNSIRTSVTQEQAESKRFQQDHTLSYDKKMGNGHSINAIAGFTTLYNYSSFVNGTRRDTSVNVPDSPEFWYVGIINANNPTTNGGGGAEGSIVGGFARVGYNYMGKYLVNATIRRDGSSKFAPENRWGTFGSIGAGWVVSDENFLNNIEAIDFLKVRVAWGVTGNANGFAENLWRPGIQNASTAIFGDNVYSSIQAAYIPDPDLHWETVQGIDVGFDVRALDNRLNAEITFYNRTTTDILTAVTLPNDSRSYFTNLGKITNKGIEISTGWGDKLGMGLNYRLSANFSYNENIVNSIGDNFNFQILGNGGVNRTNTGSSIGHFYGYTQTGIYQSVADMDKQPTFSNSLPGDISYKDLNNDGVITTADRGYIGTPFPPYSFGGNISLDYKGFDFEIDGQGAAGHKIYTQRRTATFAVLNYEANRLNAWTTPGSTNIEPILDNTRGNNFLMSTYYLEPGDYFRIRMLQVGYTFTKGFITKASIKNIRVYLSAQNLKTWSQVTGYSPEPLIGSILGGGADNGAYPVPAIYSLGINLNF